MFNVHESFLTVQGEGINTGRVAVFCRFAGCNLWSGREIDRLSAACNFCDTEFVGPHKDGGGKFRSPGELADHLSQLWPGGARLCVDIPAGVRPFVVLTGGEPAMQVSQALVSCLRGCNFEIAIETNGTIKVPPGIDWITVSPKAGTKIAQDRGDELKVVFPQDGLNPADLLGLGFKHKLIQPMDGPMRDFNTRLAVDYVLHNPAWRLSVQAHKMVGVR
jgi:7-carboxy-7-deazaguanine synthase